MTWTAANAFSSLWVALGLWVVPAAAFCVLFWRLARARRWITLVALGASALSCCLIIIVGYLLPARLRSNLDHKTQSVVIRAASKHTLCRRWHVWNDISVSRVSDGKVARAILSKQPEDEVIIHDRSRGVVGDEIGPEDVIVLIGDQATRIGEAVDSRASRVVILWPECFPSMQAGSANAKRVAIFEGPFNDAECGTEWRRWANKHGCVMAAASPFHLPSIAQAIDVAFDR